MTVLFKQLGIMRIVVLDGYALNPGDLSWSDLQVLGECTLYDRTPADKVAERANQAEIVFTNKTVLDAKSIQSLPNLRYIGVLATGTNVVDLAAARDHGVVVTNVPAYGTRSVAQHVFALLLELTQHVGYHANTVREGKWSTSSDWCYWDYPLIELEGLTMGIVGFGRIGQAVAALSSAFGMRLLAYNPRVPTLLSPTSRDVELVGLDAVFKRSDFVSLHCPLTAENQRFVNSARLKSMKPSAFLINTSRGQLINEPDLAAALNSGRLAGAALDVLASEPPSTNNPLLSARNCLVTPHIAWATFAARRRLMKIAVENLRAFLAGESVNTVN